jgi:hypothetical protein
MVRRLVTPTRPSLDVWFRRCARRIVEAIRTRGEGYYLAELVLVEQVADLAPRSVVIDGIWTGAPSPTMVN